MRKLIRSEAGNALAVSLGVLSVTGVLTASVFAVSMQLSDSSNQSRDSKKALSAADAGLEAAVYRMNKQNIQDTTRCFTATLVSTLGGECPGHTESLGNGASYTYYVTPALLSNESCAGVPISYTGEAVTITQRCVTAVGKANGVQRRIQARIASYIGLQLFSLGILGVDKVQLQNSGTLNSWIGSNGQVALNNSSTVTGIELGPSAPNAIISGSSSIGSVLRRSVSQGNHILAPVDVGNSATVNDNARITNGQDASSNFLFDPAGRILTTNSGTASITLGGGTYNFCQLTTINNATINIAVGAKVRIFIDSPTREGSGCAAGTGRFTANNKLTINNPNAPEDLQIYVYGTSGSDGASLDVEFKNQVTFAKGFIYAPQSEVEFKNSAVFTGALAAKEVEFKNQVEFNWTPSLANLRADTLAVFYKTAWKECRSKQPDPSDPESGCTST